MAVTYGGIVADGLGPTVPFGVAVPSSTDTKATMLLVERRALFLDKAGATNPASVTFTDTAPGTPLEHRRWDCYPISGNDYGPILVSDAYTGQTIAAGYTWQWFVHYYTCIVVYKLSLTDTITVSYGLAPVPDYERLTVRMFQGVNVPVAPRAINSSHWIDIGGIGSSTSGGGLSAVTCAPPGTPNNDVTPTLWTPAAGVEFVAGYLFGANGCYSNKNQKCTGAAGSNANFVIEIPGGYTGGGGSQGVGSKTGQPLTFHSLPGFGDLVPDTESFTVTWDTNPVTTGNDNHAWEVGAHTGVQAYSGGNVSLSGSLGNAAEIREVSVGCLANTPVNCGYLDSFPNIAQRAIGIIAGVGPTYCTHGSGKCLATHSGGVHSGGLHGGGSHA